VFTVVTNYTLDYQPLVDKTWYNNKVPYCERHGYNYELRLVESNNLHIHHGGFRDLQRSKINMINEILNRSEEDSWVWWTGSDLMITNFTITLESIIDSNYHFIIASDFNGINADSFLVRNSEKGRRYLKMIEDRLPTYDHWEGEQGIMKETYDEYKNDVIKMVPQKNLNAYNYANYRHAYAHLEPLCDQLGTNGDWSIGDFVIHWPATSFEYRIQAYDFYSQFIVR
jgi:hypothetical protein